MTSIKPDIWFVYDGECPICTMGSSLFTVRENVGNLYTVNARTEPEHVIMLEVKEAQLNLDDGMVIKYQDQLYYGKGALHLMSQLGADNNWFNRFNRIVFRSKKITYCLYPFIRYLRNVSLKIKGVGKINNLK